MSELVYGFHDLAHLKTERIERIGKVEVNTRIAEWNEEVNRQFNAIIASFTTRNEQWNINPITRVKTPSIARMKYVDEMGTADPQIEKGFYEQGFPIWRTETALGLSWEAMRKITVEELSRELTRIQRADMSEAIEQFLFTCFYDTNWTYTSVDDNLPNFTVRPFANGDTEREYIVQGAPAPQTADHYDAQAGDIATTDPFPNIHNKLTQYAGTSPRNLVICYVGGSTNVTNIQGLADFNPRLYTNLTNYGDDVTLVDSTADNFIGLGDKIIGEHDSGVLVIRWRRIPDNYLLSVNIDAAPAVGIRESEVASLRGLLRRESEQNTGLLQQQNFRRLLGMAAANPTGVHLQRVGNATYAPPTLYNSIPG